MSSASPAPAGSDPVGLLVPPNPGSANRRSAFHSLELRARSLSNRWLLSVGGALWAIFLLAPMISLFARGYVFGADWSEYLYSGPSYFAGTHPLFQYPYPVLPIAYELLDLAFGHTSLVPVYLSEMVSGLLVVGTFYAGYLACRQHAGSVRAGWVGGLLFAGFPLLQSEIGWGGQAQLLAYLLGLIALWITLGRVLPTLRMLPALGVGLLLALSALSELYAAATVVVILVAFLLPVLGRRLLTRNGAGVFLATSLPPALIGGALILFVPAAANPASGITLLALWRYTPVYRALWLDLTFGTWALAAVYLGVLGVYVAYRLLFRSPSPTQTWLVPATIVSTLILGILLTPAVVSYRVVYPLAFPLAFAGSELAAGWKSTPRVEARIPRWRLPTDKASHVFPIFSMAVIVLAGAQLGADFQLYPNSLETYSFSQGEISELFFLAHEPGGILYDVAPVDHMFVDLWATGRPIYPGPAFEPYTVTSASKQASVALATDLTYGVEWIDDGPFTVTDAGSAWGQPTPGILLTRDGFIFPSIESNDFQDTAAYSPLSNSSRTLTTTLYDANSTSVKTGAQGFSTELEAPGFNVTRDVAVTAQGAIDWNYTYNFTSAIPRGATVVVSDSAQVPTAGTVMETSNSGSLASLSQQFSANPLPPVDQNYTVRASSDNADLTTQFVPIDKYGIFQLEFLLSPAAPSVRNFTLGIQILPQGARPVSPTVHTEATVLESTGIEWVVLSRSSQQLFIERFMDDPTYLLYRTTPHFYILSAE